MTRLQMTGGLARVPDDTHSSGGLAAPVGRCAAQRQLSGGGVPAAAARGGHRTVSQLDNPEALSRDVLATHFNTYPPGDPRYHTPLKQRIDAVGKVPLEAVKKYHGDFYGTARGEISIVGDFDDKAIEPLLKELFAGWASKAPYALVEREYREVKPRAWSSTRPTRRTPCFAHGRNFRCATTIPMRRR